jgi:hypothetical protein
MAQRYPRRGEPLVPRLLRELVVDRRAPAPYDGDADLVHLLRTDLGSDAWRRLPAETCHRLSLAVVDRVQTRVGGLSELVCETTLPPPEVTVRLTLESRTRNVLRRALQRGQTDGTWTLRRYLSLDRFGARALVDLLAALEAQGGLLPGSTEPPVDAIALVGRLLATLAPRLPLAEGEAAALLQAESRGAPVPASPRWLANAAVGFGFNPPFRMIDLGSARLVVRVGEGAAARAAYRIAVRLVQRQGAATVSEVAERLRVSAGVPLDQAFVTRVLTALPTFRWLAPPPEEKEGWFWFIAHASPVLADLRRIFAVTDEIATPRLWRAIFRDRAGPALSEETAARLVAPIPTAVVAGGVVRVARRMERVSVLGPGELALLQVLEDAKRPLTASELREAGRSAGLSPPQTTWLLQRSPIFERSPAGYHPLGALERQGASDAA